jgi:hypothetical protein
MLVEIRVFAQIPSPLYDVLVGHFDSQNPHTSSRSTRKRETTLLRSAVTARLGRSGSCLIAVDNDSLKFELYSRATLRIIFVISASTGSSARASREPAGVTTTPGAPAASRGVFSWVFQASHCASCRWMSHPKFLRRLLNDFDLATSRNAQLRPTDTDRRHSRELILSPFGREADRGRSERSWTDPAPA